MSFGVALSSWHGQGIDGIIAPVRTRVGVGAIARTGLLVNSGLVNSGNGRGGSSLVDSTRSKPEPGAAKDRSEPGGVEGGTGPDGATQE